MNRKDDQQLVRDAQEWESAAEVLDFQNAILLTVVDAMSLHDFAELHSAKKLLECAAQKLYRLYLKCEAKHSEISSLRCTGEEVAHGY